MHTFPSQCHFTCVLTNLCCVPFLIYKAPLAYPVHLPCHAATLCPFSHLHSTSHASPCIPPECASANTPSLTHTASLVLPMHPPQVVLFSAMQHIFGTHSQTPHPHHHQNAINDLKTTSCTFPSTLGNFPSISYIPTLSPHIILVQCHFSTGTS